MIYSTLKSCINDIEATLSRAIAKEEHGEALYDDWGNSYDCDHTSRLNKHASKRDNGLMKKAPC